MKAGREMDAAVAEKVMGWTLVEGSYSLCCRTPEDYKFVIWVDSERHHHRPNNMGNFNPSTDIAAAWEVVEKIGKDGEMLFDLIQHKDKWEVFIAVPLMIHLSEAPTAPEAICLAALEAVK